MPARPLFLAGRWLKTEAVATVRSPFSDQVVSEISQAGATEIEAALLQATQARHRLAAQSSGERRAVLTGIARGLVERTEEIARSIALEAGKPIIQARTEVRRAVETFTQAAAETGLSRGELVPVDLDASSKGYRCAVRQVPAGVVVGISPFNFPLNLAAHKVAPALAVGAPLILKPPPQAPTASLIMAELAEKAGALEGALSVLPCGPELAERLAIDARVRVLSFTGSARVGWHLRDKARGRVLLELGGNAAAVVAPDADLDWAAERLAISAFAYAGQVCISVQRIIVHESVREAFTRKLLERTQKLSVGDPLEETIMVGPVIDDKAADRIMAWLEEARGAGAKVLCGMSRKGRLLSPTLMSEVPRTLKLYREEVFGPVALLSGYREFDEAISQVNDGDWGLQAALFTHDIRLANKAWDEFEVGAVIVNDSPSFRSDGMPYGGVKGSGLGREGLRYAMQELTEPRGMITAPR